MSTATTERTDRARDLNIFRRVGYRILPGDLFSYILHLRPREWPIMVGHTGVGFLLAAGTGPTTLAEAAWGDALFGIVLWVVFLNGGTLAINSAFDDDEGDIGYLDAPPKAPRHLAAFSIALMAVGQLLALRLSTTFAVVYAVCFVLSLLYSVPPARFKAVAGADWAINMAGFGTLTPIAGWALSGYPLASWAIIAFVAFAPLFAAFYPLTQIYQIEEDRERGDYTLAIALGVERVLNIALLCVAIAFALFAAAIVIGPANRFSPAFVIPLAAWVLVLVPWISNHESMTRREHQDGMYKALRAWAVTDIMLLAIFIL